MSSARDLPPPDYELREGSPATVVVAATVLLISIALVLVASAWLYVAHYGESTLSRSNAPEFSFTYGPKFQTSIARDRAAQDALTRGRLTGYDWIDRDTRIVRIPIERAMDLIANESAPSAERQTR